VVEAGFDVQANAQEAWAFLSDPRNIVVLRPQSEVRLLAGDWNAVGCRFLITEKSGRHHVEALHEIVRLEPGRLFETRIGASGHVMRSVALVEPIGPHSTRIILRGEVEWGGGLASLVPRILTALVSPYMTRRLVRQMRQAIESRSVTAKAHLGEEG